MKNIKYISWAIVILTLVILAYFYFIVFPASGHVDDLGSEDHYHPYQDFICKKSINSTCDITQVWEWDDNKERTSTWVRVTEVAYYHTWTHCETWYSVAYTWAMYDSTTAKQYVKKPYLDHEYVGDYKNWRGSVDFTYSSTGCNITEHDYVKPEWKIELIYD